MGISENRGNKDVNSGYDRSECCLSAVFFVLVTCCVLFTCWHVQFWRIFALFFPINKLLFIERFHSRGHHLCKFIGTKESIYIREEIKSHTQDWFKTPTWLPFHCFGTPIWPP